MRRFRGIRIDNVFRDIFIAGVNSSVTVANVTSEVSNNTNTVAEVSNTVTEITNTVAENSNTVAEVSNTVSEVSNTVNEVSNTFMVVALSDESTTIQVTESVVKFRAPFAMELWQIPRASLNVASSSGTVEVNIKDDGTTILTTNVTIDASETTSTTAATPAVLSTTSIADDSEISFDIVSAGTDASGLKVTIYYRKV